MCQVQKQFKLTQVGDIAKMANSIHALATVTSVTVDHDEVNVCFNHHYCTEDEIKAAIRSSGCDVQE